ncbi:PIN domain-containing protein [Streptomyces sp. NPDC058656]|uniref:PIN domain-containing protein n=1 Tax=unclassified Streptomyces TaxID=2593676 RepID=UPI00364E7B23
MIYLDSCIVRSLDLKDSIADLLRALRAVGERVGISWMVAEELVAQRVISHQEAHDSATAALREVDRHTPWAVRSQVEDPDVERVRKHWLAMVGTLAEILEPSPAAMREALFREANRLPPCKKDGKNKTGSRDAVIWLSAIEYAREHPDETVYFVSENYRDFTRGRGYPPLMGRDVAGLGERFVHLMTLDEVVQRFTEPAKADKALSIEILDSSASRFRIDEIAKSRLRLGTEPFSCTTAVGAVAQEVTISAARSFMPLRVKLHRVDNVQAFRIGEHEWYTAVAVWHMAGVATHDTAEPDFSAAGVTWTTSLLFKLDAADPGLTVLRYDAPRPLPAKEYKAFDPDALLTASLSTALRPVLGFLGDLAAQISRRGLPRAYEGTLEQRARVSAIERRLANSLAQSAQEREAASGDSGPVTPTP